jgi:hypothetical protein
MSKSCAMAKAPTVTAIALARPVLVRIPQEGRELNCLAGASGDSRLTPAGGGAEITLPEGVARRLRPPRSAASWPIHV